MFWNRAAEELLGFAANQALGKPCYLLLARYAQCTLRVPVVEGSDGVLASASVVGVDSTAGVHDSGRFL